MRDALFELIPTFEDNDIKIAAGDIDCNRLIQSTMYVSGTVLIPHT
jgi:hypothetical protein